jgi:hypothetical protein
MLRALSRAISLQDTERGLLSALVICGDRLACPQFGTLISGCYDATMNAMRAGWIRSLRPVFFPLYPECDCISSLRDLLELPEHLDPFGVVLLHRADDPMTGELPITLMN